MSEKFPLSRCRITFKKFVEVAIPVIIETLENHRKYINKYKKNQDWDKVNVEQVNASRAVLQLRSQFRESERLRRKIRHEDLADFDKKLLPLKTRTLNLVHEILTDQKNVITPSRQISFGEKCKEVFGKNVNKGDIWDDAIEMEDFSSVNIIRNKVEAISTKTLHDELIALNRLIRSLPKMGCDYKNTELSEDFKPNDCPCIRSRQSAPSPYVGLFYGRSVGVSHTFFMFGCLGKLCNISEKQKTQFEIELQSMPKRRRNFDDT